MKQILSIALITSLYAMIGVSQAATLEFTKTEAKQLIGLLDIATKTEGLTAAQPAVLWAIKIQKALAVPKEVTSETSVETKKK